VFGRREIGRREIGKRELGERLQTHHVWFEEKEGRETQNVWTPPTFCFFPEVPRKRREVGLVYLFPEIPIHCFINLCFSFLQVVVFIIFFTRWGCLLFQHCVMNCDGLQDFFIFPSHMIYIWIKEDILHYSITL
jgi:hypothetical protein